MHYACMHALFFSAHAHNKCYGLIEVVNNASGICVDASYLQTGVQSPIESESKIPISSIDLVQRESVVFWLISPGAIQFFPHTRKVDL